MNIFRLSDDPTEAARMQCDKHVVKMPLETAQMLSTAHRLIDTVSDDSVLYKPTHKNHPSSVWVRENISNYIWTFCHFIALCDEYTHRYGKVHLSYTKLVDILSVPPKNIEHGDETLTPLAMKDYPECMFPNDPVKSYRLYYATKKSRFNMKWTNREIPSWWS